MHEELQIKITELESGERIKPPKTKKTDKIMQQIRTSMARRPSVLQTPKEPTPIEPPKSKLQQIQDIKSKEKLAVKLIKERMDILAKQRKRQLALDGLSQLNQLTVTIFKLALSHFLIEDEEVADRILLEDIQDQ